MRGIFLVAMAALSVATARAADMRVAWTSAQGTGITDLDADPTGRWVVFVEEGSSELRVLDTDSWDTTSIALCSGGSLTSVGVWPGTASDASDAIFYYGCDDGTLGWATQSGGVFTQASDTVAVGAAILGLVGTPSGLYIVAEAASDGSNPEVHQLDPTDTSYTLDSNTAFPSTLYASGFEDVAATSTALFVTGGSYNVTQVNLSTGLGSLQQQSVGGTLTDLSTSSTDLVYIAGGTTGVVQYVTASNYQMVVLNSANGVYDATAVAFDEPSVEGLDGSDWFLVADAEQNAVLGFTWNNSTGSLGSSPSVTMDLGTAADTGASGGTGSSGERVVEMVGRGGYVFGGTDAGNLVVMTDRPWVEGGEARIEGATDSSVAAISGDSVSVDLTSDVDGDWSAELDDGTLLDSGSISAGETATASFTVDSRFVEGTNPIHLLVTDTDGLTGHDVVPLEVNNPPSKVTLTDTSVQFGDSQLTLSFTGVDDADLDHYKVYLTITPFSASDYDSDGPAFDGSDAIDAPVTVNGDPGADMKITLAPLTNNVTYYMAVRAYDTSGLEGPMSKVVSGTPLPTYSAAELAGEEGGMCGLNANPASALLALLGALGVAARSRRGAGAAMLLALVLPLSARADSGDDQADLVWRDASHGLFQARFGPIWLEDQNIARNFGDTGHQVLYVEAGPTWSIFELVFGTGFSQQMGWLTAQDGTRSGEHDMLTMLPLTVALGARPKVFKDQLLVPFARVGLDYWLWKENWYVQEGSTAEDHIGGAKRGWHYAFGGDLLLDTLDRSRASKLQARTGIDDSYLTVEWRRQAIGEDQQGLVFSADQVTIGVRVDY